MIWDCGMQRASAPYSDDCRHDDYWYDSAYYRRRCGALGVVGGMAVGTIALLFVVPAFYIVFHKMHEKYQGK